MKQFILIDQSITDIGGHHYEYAVRVLKAAHDAGYRTILATNRSFEEYTDAPWTIYPVYRYRFFVSAQDSRAYSLYLRLRAKMRALLFWIFTNVLLSPVGISMARNYHRWRYGTHESVPQESEQTRSNENAEITSSNRAEKETRSEKRRGLLARVETGLCDAAIKIARRAAAIPGALVTPPDQLLKYLADQRKRKAFCTDTVRLYQQIGLQNDDLVFIPTLGTPEMLGLLYYFKKTKSLPEASWHLLFRRNLMYGRDPDYSGQGDSLRPVQRAFHRFAKNGLATNVRFYTDTDQLTRQYNLLGAVDFRTLPIPGEASRHPTDFPSPPLQTMEPPATNTPLHFIYLGDARTEKGFPHLPRIIQDLWADYVESGQVRFSLQSYFNIPQGESPVVVACAQLEGYPRDKVLLINQALSSERYWELLLEGDAVLIPYDPDHYYARSSGIFVEALAAARPVIVPAGTWMALQLGEAIYRYHLEVREREHVIDTATGEALSWQGPGVVGKAGLTLTDFDQQSLTLACPEGTTHLLLTFQPSPSEPGRLVRASIRPDCTPDPIQPRSHAIIGGVIGPQSMLAQIRRCSGAVRIELSNAYSPAPTTLFDLRVDYLRIETDPPLSTVGTIYSGPDDITACIKEIIHHHSHYRASASAFSKPWAGFHNPATLIAHLEERSLSNPDLCRNKQVMREGSP